MTARSRLAVALVATLATLAVLCAALAAVAAARDSHVQGIADARPAAAAAAQHNVELILHYDYRELAQDFQAAEAVMTPAFRKKYDATTAKGVQPVAAKYKVVTRAEVTATGNVTTSASRATVLAFVQQTSTSTQLSAPRLDRSRIMVSLVRLHGRWLVDNLQPI